MSTVIIVLNIMKFKFDLKIKFKRDNKNCKKQIK